jgi:uncharacterized protein
MKTRFLAAVALGGAVLVTAAAPAWAHVTTYAVSPAHDGFVTMAFRVPNERDDAATVKLEVTFPSRPKVSFASTQPVPGWTASISRTGAQVTSITWSGGRIEPGQFQEFPVSMGQLPDDTTALTFKAVQTYDDGEAVRWIESEVAGGDEPEHPAPVLDLGAGAASHHEDAGTDAGDDDSAPVAAYAVSAAALALSVVALGQARKRSS